MAFLALAGNRRKVDGRILRIDSLDSPGLSKAEQELLATQRGYGCITVCYKLDQQVLPFIFVPRLIKGLIRCVQLVYCREVADLIDLAGTIGRYLLTLGYPLVLIDANGPIPSIPSIYFPDRSPKYYKGSTLPLLGDLTETEATIFGF